MKYDESNCKFGGGDRERRKADKDWCMYSYKWPSRKNNIKMDTILDGLKMLRIEFIKLMSSACDMHRRLAKQMDRLRSKRYLISFVVVQNDWRNWEWNTWEWNVELGKNVVNSEKQCMEKSNGKNQRNHSEKRHCWDVQDRWIVSDLNKIATWMQP